MRNASKNDLNNRKTWTQQNGTVLRVKDLTAAHRANIVRMLEREATARHIAAIDELTAMQDRANTPDDAGVLAGLIREVLDELTGTDPLAVLRATPLMKRLAKLAAKDADAAV
ncbi:hypothetical protein F1C58_16105 (plasmid) [Glaciihabitans sp. INWT7]|uniref:hypothetical protein n=1 Tax=Glaciihabitans sp. INWT7 TaxID=2596912 RepID=UPI0016289CC2|nr:hypothetical protein [Glaciihabitans sp. INWT7]QNE48584.1 hypothetical protein F1C58_16105 [Glaciihabitans sp. INWT7]